MKTLATTFGIATVVKFAPLTIDPVSCILVALATVVILGVVHAITK